MSEYDNTALHDETALLETEQRDRVEEAYNQALIENPNIDPVPLTTLTQEQLARVEALNMAKPLLSDKGLMGAKAPDLSDLLRLAEWILSGDQEPLYPYTTADMVVLGPDLNVNLDGQSIYWHGIRFNREDDNA